jgi:pimeloyl-ACP methyl ester carboxylesterase
MNLNRKAFSPSSPTRLLLMWVAALAAPACAAHGGDKVADNGSEVNAAEKPSAPVAFSPCAEVPEAECGTLTVPIDYQKPRGERLDLVVARARATGPGKRLGVLFFNPGGPGGSGVEAVFDAVLGGGPLAKLRERFDLVSFDPRGIGRSQPVECNFEPPATPAGADDEQLAAFFDSLGPTFLSSCLQRSDSLATRMGTADVARDIDALRSALREPEITYFGVSYGTILGATYASLFPRRVRAMVLDAALPPEWYSDYLVELRNENAASSELILQHIDELCREDEACPLREQGVVETLDRVVAELDAIPFVADDGAIVIDGATVLNVGANSAFYDESEGWPFYVRALAGAAEGDYELFLGALREAQPSGEDDGFGSSGFYAVVCADSATRRSGSDYVASFRAGDGVFPHFGARANPSSFTSLLTPPLEVAAACSAWPATEPTPLRNVQGRVKQPIVLFGNDFDHATPLGWTRRLAQSLGMANNLVRYQGGGHVAFGSSPCVDETLNTYLFELVPPPVGFTCPANPISFGPPSEEVMSEAGASLRTLARHDVPRHPRSLRSKPRFRRF